MQAVNANSRSGSPNLQPLGHEPVQQPVDLGPKILGLRHAAAVGDLGRLKTVAGELIDAGGDIDTPDAQQATALHHAASNGRADCVAELVRLGANLEARDCTQRTALHHAAMCGHGGVAEALLKAGCSTDIQDTV